MKTKSWAIGLTIVCTLLTSLGQIFFKKGSADLALTVNGLLLNVPFLIGLALYGAGALLLILVLRHGELSVIYPLIATSYIWVSIISPYFFPTDAMNGVKWAGIGVIIIGVSLIGFGGSR